MLETTNLHPQWLELLAPQFDKPYMMQLRAFLTSEKAAGKTIYPKSSAYFRALDLTPPDNVKIIILGQDPYHGEGQAHGLAFSVLHGVPTPPSLKNIYKELDSDLGIPPARHGFLESWATQGVLLLNNVLTVEASQAASHKKQGWEKFTDAVVAELADMPRPIVFMLWGSHAQKKAANIRDISQGGHHLVLKAPHPSPLSAHRGFLGCRHFSTANAFLQKNGQEPVNWRLPELPKTTLFS